MQVRGESQWAFINCEQGGFPTWSVWARAKVKGFRLWFTASLSTYLAGGQLSLLSELLFYTHTHTHTHTHTQKLSHLLNWAHQTLLSLWFWYIRYRASTGRKLGWLIPSGSPQSGGGDYCTIMERNFVFKGLWKWSSAVKYMVIM